MTNQGYMLVFNGHLTQGSDPEEVREQFCALFQLSRKQADVLFDQAPMAVKKDISQELARKYQKRLKAIGMLSEIRPMPGQTVVKAATPAPAPRPLPFAHQPHGDPPPADPSASEDGLDDEDNRPRRLPFRFHGQGGEYFRIWIVNILLSLLTLGIYSAWAKVRNHRYFYGNTELDGHSFEYLASPIAILKGRLIAVLILSLYVLIGNLVPLLGPVLGLGFLIALPWLVCRSMAFRNYHSRYRNIRFGFDGGYAGAFKAFVLWPLVGALSLGLAIPYVLYKQKRFLLENSRYGVHGLQPSFTGKNFYSIYLVALGMFLLGALLALIPLVGPVFTLVAYLFAFAYISAHTSNLIYNQTRVERFGFDSRLQFLRLAWIYFSNLLLILLSLGLALPWAKVRLARYRAQCLSLKAKGSLGRFIAAEEQRAGALGEEIGEAFDLDLGI
ncbi:MAG: YjgN family protein [Gammaproteobacteria bacterium SHHR-1]|uniref:YjgN family protein n=1 Tax=Magnetovirga frankeli TaxID=947516 RepID=UPI0012940D4A|nr:DUF898 domain-containing protein [gamma proteobacterium SS-5]